MHFTYCPDCGTRLGLREIGDEGPVPFCPRCARPWFDSFSSCVLVLVYNARGEILLLREDYISTVYRNLVSGYIKPGERAEDAARREVGEETGLALEEVKIVGTWWFPEKELLMIGFTAFAPEPAALRLSGEVDAAEWAAPARALALVPPRGPENATHYLVEEYLKACGAAGMGGCADV